MTKRNSDCELIFYLFIFTRLSVGGSLSVKTAQHRREHFYEHLVTLEAVLDNRDGETGGRQGTDLTPEQGTKSMVYNLSKGRLPFVKSSCLKPGACQVGEDITCSHNYNPRKGTFPTSVTTLPKPLLLKSDQHALPSSGLQFSSSSPFHSIPILVPREAQDVFCQEV